MNVREEQSDDDDLPVSKPQIARNDTIAAEGSKGAGAKTKKEEEEDIEYDEEYYEEEFEEEISEINQSGNNQNKMSSSLKS